MLFAILTTLLAQEPSFDPMEYVRAHRTADAALVAGRLGEARTGFKSCLVMSPNNPTVAYALACAEARSTNTAQALEWLDRAVEWGYADADVAVWDEDLASLRKRQRFVDALEHMRRLAKLRTQVSRLVRIWDERDEEVTIDVAVHPRDTCVAAGQSSGITRFLDAHSGRAVFSTPPFESSVLALDFDPSGEQVAILTGAGNLHLWSVKDRVVRQSVEAIARKEPSNRSLELGEAFLDFDSTGERLLVAGLGRGASLWTADGALVRRWSADESRSLLPAWSADGARIAMPVGTAVRFFNGRTGEPEGPPIETADAILGFAWEAKGRLLATGHGANRLRVWDSSTRKLLYEHFVPEFLDARLPIDPVSFSPDGRWIACGSETGSLDVLNANSGELLSHRQGSIGPGDGGCQPQEIGWSLDSDRLWCAPLRGFFPVFEVTIAGAAHRSPEFYGRAPRFGKSDLAIATCMRSILALDTRTGRCRWNRCNVGSESELLKTSMGHFTSDLESLEGLVWDTDPYFPESSVEPVPLAACVAVLFDPKRVRAARDAVAIVPANL